MQSRKLMYNKRQKLGFMSKFGDLKNVRMSVANTFELVCALETEHDKDVSLIEPAVIIDALGDNCEAHIVKLFLYNDWCVGRENNSLVEPVRELMLKNYIGFEDDLEAYCKEIEKEEGDIAVENAYIDCTLTCMLYFGMTPTDTSLVGKEHLLVNKNEIVVPTSSPKESIAVAPFAMRYCIRTANIGSTCLIDKNGMIRYFPISENRKYIIPSVYKGGGCALSIGVMKYRIRKHNENTSKVLTVKTLMMSGLCSRLYREELRIGRELTLDEITGFDRRNIRIITDTVVNYYPAWKLTFCS